MLKQVRILKEMTNHGNGKIYKTGDVKTLHPSYANELISEGKAEYLKDDCGCPKNEQPETVATVAVEPEISSVPKTKRKKRTKPNDSIA